MKTDTANVLSKVADLAGAAARYLPEPAATGVGLFRDVMDSVRGVSSDIGGVSTTASGDIGSLIQLQIDAQQEMQAATMISNLEKSKHESKMAAIRNVRVS